MLITTKLRSSTDLGSVSFDHSSVISLYNVICKRGPNLCPLDTFTTIFTYLLKKKFPRINEVKFIELIMITFLGGNMFK